MIIDATRSRLINAPECRPGIMICNNIINHAYGGGSMFAQTLVASHLYVRVPYPEAIDCDG